MPRKSAVPTITESRSKRTPKPNPKYAIDYVAKLRQAFSNKFRFNANATYNLLIYNLTESLQIGKPMMMKMRKVN